MEEQKKKGEIDDFYFDAHTAYLDEMVRPYVEGPTDEDVYRKMSHAAGMYASGFPQEYQKPDGTKKYEMTTNIIIAVGGKEERSKTTTIKSGNRTIVSFDQSEPTVAPIKGKHSYPQPEHFTMTQHPVYPLMGIRDDDTGSVGTTTRHEFYHQASGHPFTDHMVFDSYKRAAEALKKGSDRLYYFVFKKKGKDGKPDEILVTQDEKSTRSEPIPV